MIPTETAALYRAGNVLIFADKKIVDLGYELAKADDIAAAREYLANSETLLYERMQELQAQNAELAARIEQRDELLRDLSSDLRREQDMAAILKGQLNEVYCQLEIEALSRSEMVDDLQQISVETHTVEIALEKTLAEKVELEQELAARIVDLVELNFQNDDLKRQLEKRQQPLDTAKALDARPDAVPASMDARPDAVLASMDAPPDAAFVLTTSAPTASTPSVSTPLASTQTATTPATAQTASAQTAVTVMAENKEAAHVLTVSSGKQVHVYHEFSAPPRRSARAGASLALRTILRTAAILLVVALLFAVLSVAATAWLNDVSFGEALDFLLAMIPKTQG